MKMDIKLRKIEQRDVTFFWYLRNRPEVYRYFMQARPVLWEEHVEWVMPYVLGLRDGELYAIEMDGTLVGQVRVDYEDNEGVISISILSEFWGKGIASHAVESLCELVKSDGKVPVIRAEIHKDNEASVGLFVRSGFAETEAKGDQRQFLYNV